MRPNGIHLPNHPNASSKKGLLLHASSSFWRLCIFTPCTVFFAMMLVLPQPFPRGAHAFTVPVLNITEEEAGTRGNGPVPQWGIYIMGFKYIINYIYI
jgi:hypothetical protein